MLCEREAANYQTSNNNQRAREGKREKAAGDGS